MPRVRRGTNDPVHAALLAVLRSRQPLDRSLAEFVLLLALGDIAFHRIAEEGRDRGARAGHDADQEPLDRLAGNHRCDRLRFVAVMRRSLISPPVIARAGFRGMDREPASSLPAGRTAPWPT